MSLGTFYILGRPLQENVPGESKFASLISQSHLIIGESRKITERLLSRLTLSKEASIFYLDNQKPQEQKALAQELRRVSQENGQACLFSDMGMPILFDPGAEVLEQAKALGMKIRVLPGPTSWATACAVSGWLPPFHLVGFLSVKAEMRSEELSQLKSTKAHLVFLDTPYRFHTLLTDCCKEFGKEHHAFLAWEIGMPEERYWWGTLGQIIQRAEKEGLKKGEFILLLQKPSVK